MSRVLSFAVMHHPSRQHLLGRLMRHIPDAVVVVDPEPNGAWNPWRCARLAWRAGIGDRGFHVVVQDDAVVDASFAEVVEDAVFHTARPCAWSFCAGAQHEWSGVHPATTISGVACALPARRCDQFLRWGEGRRVHGVRDDSRLFDYCRSRALEMLTLRPRVVWHDEPRVEAA